MVVEQLPAGLIASFGHSEVTDLHICMHGEKIEPLSINHGDSNARIKVDEYTVYVPPSQVIFELWMNFVLSS